MSDSETIKLSALDLMPDWVTNLEKTLPQGLDEGTDSDGGERRGRDRRGGAGNEGGKRRPREGQGGGRPFDHDRDRGHRSGGGPAREGGRRDFGNRDRENGQGRSRDHRGGGGGTGRGRFREDRREAGGGRFQTGEQRPPSGVTVTVEPSAESVAALARHIRGTGRTYALVDLAKMILQGRERYQLRFRAESPEERPLYFCGADDSLWLSREEALAHVLKGPSLDRYYRIEDVPVEPPRGHFSVVAVCGLSGVVLGPPNHHDYTMKVVRLHKERFSDMPFERFKSRIEMHRDEESIEKWKAEVSIQRQYRPRPEPLAPGEEDPGASVVAAPSSSEVTEASAEAPGAAEAPIETDDPVSSGEAAIETADTAPEAAADSDSPAGEENAETLGASEPISSSTAGGEIIKSTEALERHFKQHFADIAAQAVTVAVIPGSVSGKKLSSGLLTLLKIEVDRQRKSFPLGMIQHLCREFETAGLRFFKRGKKALHVCVARPRAIEDENALSERVREIIRFVREHPRKKVVDLLDALVSDYQRPAEGESFEQHHLTEKEHAVLADLRWLTMEGYLLEFPGTELVLAKMDPPPPPASKTKAKKGQPGEASAAEPEPASESNDLPDQTDPSVPTTEPEPEPASETDDQPNPTDPIAEPNSEQAPPAAE